MTTRDVGGRATYTCNSGFRLVGSSIRTCLIDGSWSGSQPICNCKLHQLLTLSYTGGNISNSLNVLVLQFYTDSVLCPSLVRPTNGRVSVSSNFVGGSAYYWCNSGYRLSGSSYRYCQVSEEWSGPQPVCISKYHLRLCTLSPICLFYHQEPVAT